MSLKIEVGVIWYQLIIEENNSVTIKLIDTLHASAQEHESYPGSSKDTLVQTNLMNKMIQSCGSTLELKTKSLSPFKLVGKITNTNKNSYQLNIQSKGDIFLDDYYWIMENAEENGATIAKKEAYFI